MEVAGKFSELGPSGLLLTLSLIGLAIFVLFFQHLADLLIGLLDPMDPVLTPIEVMLVLTAVIATVTMKKQWLETLLRGWSTVLTISGWSLPIR